MRTECQRILIHLLLLISRKLLVITRSPITTQLTIHRSPIAFWSDEAVLLNFFHASESENLNPPSKIAFPDTIYF